MQLSPQETSKAWWGGAIKGAISAVPQGLIIGAVASAFLFFAVVPAAAALGVSLAPVFGLFIATGAGAFNPLPMMMFNVAILGIANAITGGATGVKDYHQQKHNTMYEARISALEERTPGLTKGQELEPLQQSRAVSKILAEGQRHPHSHAEAEQLRDATSPSRSVH